MYIEIPNTSGTPEGRKEALKAAKPVLSTSEGFMKSSGVDALSLIRLATYIETGHDYLDTHPESSVVQEALALGGLYAGHAKDDEGATLEEIVAASKIPLDEEGPEAAPTRPWTLPDAAEVREAERLDGDDDYDLGEKEADGGSK